MNRLYNDMVETCTYLDEECAKGKHNRTPSGLFIQTNLFFIM